MNGTVAAECIFCTESLADDRPVVVRTQYFVAVKDKYPVNVGHTLVVPCRHVGRLRDLTVEEFVDLRKILTHVQDTLARQNAEGFNIGVNEGEVAGQTVFHLHVHVIPRYAGDVASPRGGIRNLKPALVEY